LKKTQLPQLVCLSSAMRVPPLALNGELSIPRQIALVHVGMIFDSLDHLERVAAELLFLETDHREVATGHSEVKVHDPI
jgi:hypothetical protein